MKARRPSCWKLAVDPDEKQAYPFEIEGDLIRVTPVIQAVVSDLRASISQGRIAARFHNGLADLSIEICNNYQLMAGVFSVALSGGVWQNRTLLELTLKKLKNLDAIEEIFIHHKLPPNDGCIAWPVMVAAHQKK